MALTGICLVLFVTFHVLMNAVALIWPAAYNQICMFLGANWYALIASAGLALLFIIHIIYALWLTVQNRKARGNDRYAVNAHYPGVEWSSKNMLVLGIVVVAFMVIHFIQFWAKMQFAEICEFDVVDTVSGESVPAAAGTWFLEIAFRQWWTLPVYLIGFIALWFHMTHGFWSMMQTVGWDNDTWMKRLKCIGNAWVTIVIGLFVAEAVVFTIQANRNAYTTCPKLVNQYEAMAAEGKAVFAEPGCTMFDGCGNAAACPDSKPCNGNAACNKAVCGEAACGMECAGACVEGNCAQGECRNANCTNAACASAEVEVAETETVISND